MNVLSKRVSLKAPFQGLYLVSLKVLVDDVKKKNARGMACSASKAHLQGDNLMDVVDSAFSIHNSCGILSSEVQMHNECLS